MNNPFLATEAYASIFLKNWTSKKGGRKGVRPLWEELWHLMVKLSPKNWYKKRYRHSWCILQVHVMFQKCAPLSAPLFWILWRLWNAIGKPLPSILWNFFDFEGNPRTSETNWKVTAPLFYTFVNFTIWTKFFLITIWSRNALVWLCRLRSEKHIRSASMPCRDCFSL